MNCVRDPETMIILCHVFLKVRNRWRSHWRRDSPQPPWSTYSADSLLLRRLLLQPAEWPCPGCLLQAARQEEREDQASRWQPQSSCWTSTTSVPAGERTQLGWRNVPEALPGIGQVGNPRILWGTVPIALKWLGESGLEQSLPQVSIPTFFTAALTLWLRLGQIALALPQSRALGQRVPLPSVPAGLGTARLLPVPPVRWKGERDSRRHPGLAGSAGPAAAAGPGPGSVRARLCPRGVPGAAGSAGMRDRPAPGAERSPPPWAPPNMFLAGEARGDAVRRGALFQQLLRRESQWHGAAPQPAALPGSLEEKQPGRHAARQGKGLRGAGGGGRGVPDVPIPADGGVVAGAGGAALRGAAPAPPGGRQDAQAAAGADPELRRAARGAAGAAVRAAGGGHAQRLPPHPAARAAGPPAQRQLPRRGAAARGQESAAPRQPAQRIALGIQVTPGAGGREVRPPQGARRAEGSRGGVSMRDRQRRLRRAVPGAAREARGGRGTGQQPGKVLKHSLSRRYKVIM